MYHKQTTTTMDLEKTLNFIFITKARQEGLEKRQKGPCNIENLEKNLKNTLKIAGNPDQIKGCVRHNMKVELWNIKYQFSL